MARPGTGIFWLILWRQADSSLRHSQVQPLGGTLTIAGSNKYFPGEFRALCSFSLLLSIDALPPLKRERDRSSRVAGALDNRSRRTSRSWRVSGTLGNLNAPVDCSGCNLSLSSPARVKDSPRLRIFVLRVCEASQISHIHRREMLKLGLVCFQLPMSVQLAIHEVGATAARGMEAERRCRSCFANSVRLASPQLVGANLNTERTLETLNEIYD